MSSLYAKHIMVFIVNALFSYFASNFVPRVASLSIKTAGVLCVGKGLVPFLKPVDLNKYEEGVKPPPYKYP